MVQHSPMTRAFTGPMQPAPALSSYARRLTLQDGTALFLYDSGGDGPAIFLLHGLQDEADTWRHIFGPLSARYRVIAPDLPGFGRSDKRPRGYGPPFYAGVVGALAETLGIERFALAGNSLGAIVAETFALGRPSQVSALVLLDGTLRVVARPASRLTFLQSLFPGYFDRKYFEALRAGPPEAPYRTLRPFYADLDGLPEADRKFLFQRVNERVWDEPQRLAARAINAGLVPFFLTAGRRLVTGIPALNVPTLVVWGGADAIFPRENALPRAEAQPGAECAILPGVGHLPQQDLPHLLLTVLLPFLEAAIPR